MSALLAAESAAFLLAALALGSPRGRSRPWPAAALALCLAALTATFAFAWSERRGREREASRRLEEATPSMGGGGGFLTSDACRACHPDQYASWRRSYHRTMTQVARPETVIAPFDGIELESRGRTYRLERRGGEHWARLVDPDWERQQRLAGRDVDFHPDPPYTERQVVMTTGSHHMQTYWVESRHGREVYNLPFVFLFSDRRWLPREDVFLRPPGAGRFLGLWNNSCIECHTTGGRVGFDFTAEVFDSSLVEPGISCEACHGPAREHVEANRNPLRRYRQYLTEGGDPTIVQPARLPQDRSSQVCGQCHGVWLADDEMDWLANGHAFRAGDDLEATRFLVRPARGRDHPRLRELLARSPDALRSRFWDDGMVRVSGREMSAMIESPCYQRGEMTCLSCHSLHDSDPEDQLAAGMGTDRACLQCHGGYAPPQRLAAHTHHPAGSSGSRCYNCHMPHTTYGLLTAIRSHQVSSPSVQESLRVGRPNACNLCHLDRSLGWTARSLEAWYGIAAPPLPGDREEVSAALLWLLTGDAGQRALVAWSMGWEPAREAGGRTWLAPYLGHLLDDPYAAVRYIAGRSLATLPGWEGLEVDFLAPPPRRAQDRDAVLRRWIANPAPPDRTGARVLMGPRGELELEEIARLARLRDDRPLFLAE